MIRVPTAHGPQFHADELDSAWSSIRPMVNRTTANALSRLGQMPPVRNPPGVDDQGEGDATIETWRLAEPSMLITGEWGPPSGMRVGDRRRRLDIIRNPDEGAARREDTGSILGGVGGSFFDRMAVLEEQLSALIARARAKYAGKVVALKGRPKGSKATRPAPVPLKDQDWTQALMACRADVRWVREQRALAMRGEARVVRFWSLPSSKDHPKKGCGPLPTDLATLKLVRVMGLPAERTWGILAEKGNQKLPFAAYSTLPMATCPGAGGCSVTATTTAKPRLDGYCYSVKAWRYPDAFARQFRNTLAEFADREFAICAALGEGAATADYEARVRAALSPAGRAARTWHRFIGLSTVQTLRTKMASKDAKQTFIRIYVDGDIYSEDNIVEWMDMCRDIGKGGCLVQGLDSHIEAYGYSKCWNQFVNADRAFINKWPDNYTVNMSSDSFYAGKVIDGVRHKKPIEEEMCALPITRGYFESIPLSKAVPQLNNAFVPASDGKPDRMKSFALDFRQNSIPFPFSAKRVETLVVLNGRMAAVDKDNAHLTLADVAASKAVAIELAAKYGISWTPKVTMKRTIALGDGTKKRRPLTNSELKEQCRSAIEQIRHGLFRAYFASLLTEGEGFRGIVEEQLAMDDITAQEFAALKARNLSDKEMVRAMVREWHEKSEKEKFDAAMKKAREEGTTLEVASEEAAAALEASAKRAGESAVAKHRAALIVSKAWQDKAIALSLHESLMAFGPMGSCPLVCGNCMDTTSTAKNANPVHRCASKDAFKDRTIFIGRH